MNAESTAEAEAFLAREGSADGRARIRSATSHSVHVTGGTITVFHVSPVQPVAAAAGAGGDDIPGVGRAALRPIVFVSGWGTIPESFHDFYGALPPGAEIYHVETREKSSSRLSRRGADFSMDQMARDVRTVLAEFGLDERNPVLMGTCFGSAVIVHGLAAGILDAPTVVCVDPMDKLWFPRWIIEILGPVLPSFGLWLLRPFLRMIVLAGMKEPVQRKRAKAFIDSAQVWKWRKAAIHTRKWNIFHYAPSISRRVFVVNGSHDRFHNSDSFPRVARALIDGLFVRIPVGESRRERLMGVVAGVFAGSDPDRELPGPIEPFVIPLESGDVS